jgi:anti-sigma factor (TIGR02949 family)
MKLNRDMTCTEIVELITEYLEGGLSTADRERFEEHIGFCDWCLAYLDQMRHTISAVGQLCEEDLPEELQRSLLDAFRDWRTEPA